MMPDNGANWEIPEIAIARPLDEQERLLRQVLHNILLHPIAAQALFRALVKEGRRFAATTEGSAIRDEIAESEFVRKGRVVWEVVSLRILEEDGDTILPTKLLEAFAALTHSHDMEAVLATMFDGEQGHE